MAGKNEGLRSHGHKIVRCLPRRIKGRDLLHQPVVLFVPRHGEFRLEVEPNQRNFKFLATFPPPLSSNERWQKSDTPKINEKETQTKLAKPRASAFASKRSPYRGANGSLEKTLRWKNSCALTAGLPRLIRSFCRCRTCGNFQQLLKERLRSERRRFEMHRGFAIAGT